MRRSATSRGSPPTSVTANPCLPRTRSLTPDDVRRFVDERVFTPRWDAKVGIELEWVITSGGGPTSPTPDVILGLVPDALPGGSKITFEPGGQLELSGPPHAGIAAACHAMAADLTVVRNALAPSGIELTAIGLDPQRSAYRASSTPRATARWSTTSTRAGPRVAR